jgi:hypothetical protein
MKNTFRGVLWSSFNAINGWFLGGAGILIGVLLIRFPFNTPLPLDLVLIVGFFTLLTFFVLINALHISLQEYQKLRRRTIPSIELVTKENNSDAIICLLEYSEIFAYDMMVSAYYTNQDNMEVLIATGFVKNIQDNGKIVVQLPNLESGQEEILKKIAGNDKSILNRTVIKPGISKTIFNKLLFDTHFNQP